MNMSVTSDVEWQQKTAAVMGGAGFIGSWVVDKLVQRGFGRIVIVDNFFLGKESNLSYAKSQLGERLKVHTLDAMQLEPLKSVFWKEEHVDVVYNLAVKPLLVSFIDPFGVFETSVKIAQNLLEIQRLDMFDVLVQVSSSEAYGSAKRVPMDEEHPLNPTTPYGAGKAAADHLVTSYILAYGIEAAIIRPFNCYGPRQNDRSYAAIVPTVIKRILHNEPPIIYGDGNQTRDYTFVEDTASAIVEGGLRKEAKGEIINVATGREVPITDLVKMITLQMGHQGSIIHEKERPGDVRRHCADISKAKKLLHFSPKVTYEEGLRRTIEWYSDD